MTDIKKILIASICVVLAVAIAAGVSIGVLAGTVNGLKDTVAELQQANEAQEALNASMKAELDAAKANGENIVTAEEFETKLAAALGEQNQTMQALISTAVKNQIEELETEGLTEAQVQEIIDAAVANCLTEADIDAIVAGVDAGLTKDEVKKIVADYTAGTLTYGQIVDLIDDADYDLRVYLEKQIKAVANAVKDLGGEIADLASGAVATADELKAAFEKGGLVTLTENIDLATAIVVDTNVVLDLNGKTLTVKNDPNGDGVFHVIAGGKLTINGEGIVNGVGDNDYSMAIWADGGEVIINGGTYTNVGAGEDDHYDLIYAKNGGKVTINGGTFNCQTPAWTLNLRDNSNSTIEVKGGTFVGFNPAEAWTEPAPARPKNFVAEGYVATPVEQTDGSINWVVAAGTTVEVKTANELAAVIAQGGNVTLKADIDLSTAIVVEKEVTLNLDGKTLNGANVTSTQTILVKAGGNLTINGDGNVIGAGKNANGYAAAIWAYGGTVTINGGTYTNSVDGTDDHYDLIYASAQGTIVINGGSFKAKTPNWTLNLLDKDPGTIKVYGGTFYGYDPSNSASENPVANFVAEGYAATESNGVYTVVFGVMVKDSAELNAAVAAGKTEIYLLPGEYTVDLYSTSIPHMDSLTINGCGADTKVKFGNLQARLALVDNLTINNCTIERMPDKAWGHLVFGSSNTAGGVYTISNCIFNGVGSQGIYINQDVEATFNIENCTFNGDFGTEGAITVQNNADVAITVNVTECEFNKIPETSHEIYVLYAYDGWKLNAEGVNAYWKAN